MLNDMVAECNKVIESLGIKAECVKAEKHRHLAFYDIALAPGTRVRRIEMFAREIAIGLKSKTNPIVTSIPEEGVVRIRVAYENSETLHLEDLLKTSERPEGILPILLGETDQGKPLWVDFAMHPHTLIAGGTGSGKSTALHTIIANIIHQKDVMLYLVDPKSGVEFSQYKSAVCSLATSYEATLVILKDLHKSMENRYSLMNKMNLSSSEKLLSKIVLIIDEVADLMMYDSAKENPNRGQFEKLLITLAQKSRAAGIYIILATQRPSTDIIKGTIKANFPARLACKVSSAVDSKVVLDKAGAETLLGRGDAILNNHNFDCARFQVAYTTPQRTMGTN